MHIFHILYHALNVSSLVEEISILPLYTPVTLLRNLCIRPSEPTKENSRH
jgi:hypothetical protein